MCKFTLLGINELYFILENELRRHNYVWSYFDSPSRLPTEMSAPIKPKTTAALETEKQKLKEDKVMKAKAAKKDQADLKAAAEAKTLAEETKLKLGEVELDCGEAVTKYKDLQEPKSEADMKYLEAEREVGEVRIFFTFERNLT